MAPEPPTPPPVPRLTPKAQAAKAERDQRLAAALRKNLRRRKAATSEPPAPALPNDPPSR